MLDVHTIIVAFVYVCVCVCVCMLNMKTFFHVTIKKVFLQKQKCKLKKRNHVTEIYHTILFMLMGTIFFSFEISDLNISVMWYIVHHGQCLHLKQQNKKEPPAHKHLQSSSRDKQLWDKKGSVKGSFCLPSRYTADFF